MTGAFEPGLLDPEKKRFRDDALGRMFAAVSRAEETFGDNFYLCITAELYGRLFAAMPVLFADPVLGRSKLRFWTHEVRVVDGPGMEYFIGVYHGTVTPEEAKDQE